MEFLAKASAILLAFGAEVEGADGRIGASGVGGMIAGDGFALESLRPAIFLLLCIKSRLEQVKIKMAEI
jgi:hypothetical protein